MLSSKFSRRHAALLASRSSPARRCAREDCDLESTPKRRKTFSSSFRPSLFGLVGRRAVFRFAPITRCETRTKSDAGRAGQRRLERERTRCETLAGTHNAREHAIRRGHDGAIRRFERRMRAHARRASRVASRVVRGGTAPWVPEERATAASPAPHATSRSPRASGGQPGARARLKKHATPAPRRERDAEARARGAEARGRGTKKSEGASCQHRRSRATRANAGVARRSTSEKSAMERCRYGGRGVPAALVRAHAPCACRSDALFFFFRRRRLCLRFERSKADFGTLIRTSFCFLSHRLEDFFPRPRQPRAPV